MLGTELLDIAFAVIFGCIFLARVLRGYLPARKAILMLVLGWAALGAGRFLALFIGLGSLQGSVVIWNLAATGALALLLYGLLLTFEVKLGGESKPRERRSPRPEPASMHTAAPTHQPAHQPEPAPASSQALPPAPEPPPAPPAPPPASVPRHPSPPARPPSSRPRAPTSRPVVRPGSGKDQS